MLNIEQTTIALGAGALVGVLASIPQLQTTGMYTPGIAAVGLGAAAGLLSKNGGAMTVASYSALGVGALLIVSAYQASKAAPAMATTTPAATTAAPQKTAGLVGYQPYFPMAGFRPYMHQHRPLIG